MIIEVIELIIEFIEVIKFVVIDVCVATINESFVTIWIRQEILVTCKRLCKEVLFLLTWLLLLFAHKIENFTLV